MSHRRLALNAGRIEHFRKQSRANSAMARAGHHIDTEPRNPMLRGAVRPEEGAAADRLRILSGDPVPRRPRRAGCVTYAGDHALEGLTRFLGCGLPSNSVSDGVNPTEHGVGGRCRVHHVDADLASRHATHSLRGARNLARQTAALIGNAEQLELVVQ